MNRESTILNIEDVAQYFRKSPSWVYKNWKILGGRKLGGSLIFPAKEDLYEYVFCEKEGVEVRLHSKRNQGHKSLVQNEERSFGSGIKKEGGNKESGTGSDAKNRHGLLDVGK